jgi:serralysin
VPNALRLVLSAAAAGCVLAAPAHAAITSKNLGSIWFVGDSITQSNADNDSNGSPRKSLYDKLNAAGGYSFDYTGHYHTNVDGLPPTAASLVYHSGVSGAVIGNNVGSRVGIAQNVPTWWTLPRLATNKPNVILIMLGTNDTNADIAPATAPARLEALVDLIFAQPGAGSPSVFLATIPPSRISSVTIQRVAAFNAALPGVVSALRAEGKDVTLVDHFTPLDNAYATSMRSDNLHPNSVGNDIIAQQWFNAINARATPEPTTAASAVAAMMAAGLRMRRQRRYS